MLQIKTMISDINSIPNAVDARIIELGNRSTECIQDETERKKRMITQSITVHLRSLRQANMYNWCARRKRDLNGGEKYLLRPKTRTF